MPTVATPKQNSVKPFPFLDLKAQYRSIKPEIDAAIQRVMESQHFILGPEVESLEKEIAAYSHSQFGIGCASGSDALLLALMALEIGPGDEVITTPFTFVATAGAIARLRARPVFVDIDPETYNIHPLKIDAAVTSNTKAIIPVHLFGMAADMDAIMKIAKAKNIPVVEDAAQAIGASYAGKPVGSIGLCGCFSFFPSKNLGGAGDGGMLTTNDSALAAKLRVLRTHGSLTKYDYELIGMNSRLDALQAAILRVKLSHLDTWARGRQSNAERYSELFKSRRLDSIIKLPKTQPKCNHIYNQYVIRAPKRDELKSYLRECGVPSEIYYPIPLHVQRAFAYLDYKQGELPESEAACKEVLALPVFPEMTAEQLELVVESIASFYSE
ncbi:MAG TPA: DegT/DnrJ/EryC1/StrS family aminotransferase [Candidatus Sulfotelmatobacter sp.]|nr:DegT/DnrJ/EryC1/StrS family aminotransferase [Candidatus Sulfotelmatobacter sp.]